MQLAYVEQSRDTLNPDKTVWEEISEGNEQIKIGDRLVNSRAYVARFQLWRPDQQKKVGSFPAVNATASVLAKMLKVGRQRPTLG